MVAPSIPAAPPAAVSATAAGRPRRRLTLAVDLLGAVALAVVGALAVGWSPALVGVLYLAAVTPALARIDMRAHRLPNRLVLPGYAAAALTVAGNWIVIGSFPLAAVIAGAAGFAFLLLLNLFGGMGMGDVKLGGVLGLILGSISVDAAVLGPTVAFLCGGLAAAVLMLIRRRRGTRMPFGPFLLLGFWGAVLLGSPS